MRQIGREKGLRTENMPEKKVLRETRKRETCSRRGELSDLGAPARDMGNYYMVWTNE